MLRAIALLVLAPATWAQSEATPQRPSFTTDASTTTPGTAELELGGVRSRGFFGLPNTLKLAPFGRTELSVGFDTINPSDGFGLAVRRALIDGDRFSLAVSPQALFLLPGARIGASAIAVYELERNSVIANLAWSAATEASAENPARQYDAILGYARAMGPASLFAEYLHEFPSGIESRASLMQGVSYRLRPDLVVDLAVQQTGLETDSVDIGFLAGLTVNLGKLW